MRRWNDQNNNICDLIDILFSSILLLKPNKTMNKWVQRRQHV